MAKVKLNRALAAIHGRIDGYVFRRYRGKVVLQRDPVFTKPRTPKQAQTSSRFAAGSAFAKRVKADPVLHGLYAARGRELDLNYRQVAIRDQFHSPDILELQAQGYDPARGGTLLVHAVDDFEVVRVTLTLRDAHGAEVWTSDALLALGYWRLDVPPLAVPIATVVVVARDRPGNTSRREFALR